MFCVSSPHCQPNPFSNKTWENKPIYILKNTLNSPTGYREGCRSRCLLLLRWEDDNRQDKILFLQFAFYEFMGWVKKVLDVASVHIIQVARK